MNFILKEIRIQEQRETESKEVQNIKLAKLSDQIDRGLWQESNEVI